MAKKRGAAGLSLPPSKHGRGGYLQRLAAEGEEEAQELERLGEASSSSECALSAFLISEVMWGLMSAAKGTNDRQCCFAIRCEHTEN